MCQLLRIYVQIPVVFKWKVLERLSAVASGRANAAKAQAAPRDEANETLVECEQSLLDAVRGLDAHSSPLRAALVEQAAALCSRSTLRAVPDVPRLYRKTNRPAPTRPSQYMSELIGALEQTAADCSRAVTRVASARLSEALADLPADARTTLEKEVARDATAQSTRIRLEICASILEAYVSR